MAMLDSQKLLQIQYILAKNGELQNLLKLISSMLSKYTNFITSAFADSPQLHFLISEINKLKMPQLNIALDKIKNPQTIVALPIKMEKNFTLFFVIVPNGLRFNWHSHPKMVGITKCIHGHLVISAIDLHLLQPISPIEFFYQREHIRIEDIKYNNESSVSTIYPFSYNVHKIEAQQLSAFFDLLIPDYPQNVCHFYDIAMENQQKIMFKLIPESQEIVKGLDVQIKQYQELEKHVVKNVILK